MIKFKDIIFEKNVAIHCPEEWMANELLKYADSKGYHWCNGISYLRRNSWGIYQEDTVYYIGKGRYGKIDNVERNKYKILHYNDVLIKEGGE